MPRYIAIKDKRNQSTARKYCSSTKLNGTLCSFQNDFDWKKIFYLIETVEYNETNYTRTRYWIDRKLDNQNVEFMNCEDTKFAENLHISGNASSKCVVVANRSCPQHWPCDKEEYFICDTAKEYIDTEGICKVETLCY